MDSRQEGVPREQLDISDNVGPSTGLADRLSMLNISKGHHPHGSAGERPLKTSTFGSSVMGSQREEEGKPSLMDQMLAEATTAQQKEAQVQRDKYREQAKRGFGQGLKKGFLSNATSGVRKGGRSKCAKATGGSDDNGTVSSKTSISQQEASERRKSPCTTSNMPIIRGRKAKSGNLEFDVSTPSGSGNPSLVLPEVQEAMKKTSSLSGPAMGTEWLTPELLDKVSEKPRLAALLNDPRFGKALQLMSTSPQEAMALFSSNSEAREAFMELSALLAEHFTSMGQAADERAAKDEADRERVAAGPLAQKALRQAATRNDLTATSLPQDEEQSDVKKVLQDPELRELLLDPQMQRVLQECGEPDGLVRYVHHPEYGPKLQLMARAGLVSIQP